MTDSTKPPNPPERDTRTLTDLARWIEDGSQRDTDIMDGLAAFFRGEAKLTVVPVPHGGAFSVNGYIVGFVRDK
jgi:hypothetical protein